MIKNILKYSFIFYCIIISVVAHSTALSFNEFNGKDVLRTEKSQIFLNKLRLGADYFTAPNCELNKNHSVISLVQKEINFDEITLKKDKLVKNLIFATSSKVHFSTVLPSEIVHSVPPYSFFEEFYQTWYILFEVFRI